MATKHFCDRCGEETSGGLYRIVITTRIYSTADGIGDDAETSLDLCAQCTRSIINDANTPLKGRK